MRAPRSWLPLTPLGLRKVRRYDQGVRADGEIQLGNISALTDADKAWLTSHGWDHSRETWDAICLASYTTTYH